MLKDLMGRAFPYLRLSVTEACNFRCTYCLPDGYQKTGDHAFLSVDEITRLVSGFADLGVEKVRLTGGEPTVRHDITAIAASISALGRLRTLAMTTNGYRLKQQAQAFADAGINALNVSIDSLDAAKFQRITGHDRLKDILEGIDLARKAGIGPIKINCVLIKGVNDDEWPDFAAWARREALSVRFIELMQTGDNGAYFHKHHLSGAVLQDWLVQQGYGLCPREALGGPAVEYARPDHAGRMGIIAPYSKDFCTTCNRLRVTARGDLRLCLFGEYGYGLRPYLQTADQRGELTQRIADLLSYKTRSHHLGQGQTGLTPHLASIGG